MKKKENSIAAKAVGLMRLNWKFVWNACVKNCNKFCTRLVPKTERELMDLAAQVGLKSNYVLNKIDMRPRKKTLNFYSMHCDFSILEFACYFSVKNTLKIFQPRDGWFSHSFSIILTSLTELRDVVFDILYEENDDEAPVDSFVCLKYSTAHFS